MKAAIKQLQQLQSEIQEWNLQVCEEYADDGYGEPPIEALARVCFAPVGKYLHVGYWGPCNPEDGEPFDLFLSGLQNRDVASAVCSLDVSGPDEGANGLQDWCFDKLLEGSVVFDQLKIFSVKISDPGDHNESLIEEWRFIDNAVANTESITNLVARMPKIEELAIPSAPSSSAFFAINLKNLHHLRVQRGQYSRRFVHYLSQAKYLPALSRLDFTDSGHAFLRPNLQCDESKPTSYSDFQTLFESDLFDHVSHFTLRNAQLTEVQYRALQALRPECQFSVVLSPPHCYVAHWRPDRFPYQHLLWADSIAQGNS